MALFIWVFHKCIILNICNILMFLNLIIAKVFSVLEFAQDIVDWEPLKIQKNSIFYHSSSHHNEKILQSYESTFESRTQTIFKSAPGIFLLVFLILFQGALPESRTENFPGFLSWNISNSTLCKRSLKEYFEGFSPDIGKHGILLLLFKQPHTSSGKYVQWCLLFWCEKNWKVFLENISDCYFVFFFWYVVAGESE